MAQENSENEVVDPNKGSNLTDKIYTSLRAAFHDVGDSDKEWGITERAFKKAGGFPHLFKEILGGKTLLEAAKEMSVPYGVVFLAIQNDESLARLYAQAMAIRREMTKDVYSSLAMKVVDIDDDESVMSISSKMGVIKRLMDSYAVESANNEQTRQDPLAKTVNELIGEATSGTD